MLEFIEVVPSQFRINFSCVDDIVVFLNKTFSVVDKICILLYTWNPVEALNYSTIFFSVQ